MELITWILFTECTDSDCLRSLLICHQSDSSQDLVLSTSDSWHTHVQQDHRCVSSTEWNNKTLTTLFLTRSLCTANIKGANIYKNVKCTDSLGPSPQHSSQILAARVNNFNLSLVSSLTLLFPQTMLLDANCNCLASYWRSEKSL
jgi:hypothetical protein